MFGAGEAQLGGDTSGVDAEGFDLVLVFGVYVFNYTVYSGLGNAVGWVPLCNVSIIDFAFLELRLTGNSWVQAWSEVAMITPGVSKVLRCWIKAWQRLKVPLKLTSYS
jgi:hypothetical protein